MSAEDNQSNSVSRTPDKQAMAAHFQRLLEQHGDHFSSLDWESSQAQSLRFSILLHVPIYACRTRNFSLLDVGCGFGDLYLLLKEKGWLEKVNVKYTGVDITPGMIEVAKKKYPETDFKVLDIFEEDCEQFDFVVSSGIFNTRVSEADDYRIFVRKIIQRMFQLCRFGVAANFQSTLILDQHPQIQMQESFKKYYYYDPVEMLNFAKDLTNKFVLRHDYHPADFTLFLIKNYGEG